jgi:hypothetical protein
VDVLLRESAAVAEQPLQSVRAEGNLQRAAELRIDHGHQRGGFHKGDLVRVGLYLYRADEIIMVVLEPARNKHIINMSQDAPSLRLAALPHHLFPDGSVVRPHAVAILANLRIPEDGVGIIQIQRQT